MQTEPVLIDTVKIHDVNAPARSGSFLYIKDCKSTLTIRNFEFLRSTMGDSGKMIEVVNNEDLVTLENVKVNKNTLKGEYSEFTLISLDTVHSMQFTNIELTENTCG